MLHADMILRKRFTTRGKFDKPSCSSMDSCPDQPVTGPIVSKTNRSVSAKVRLDGGMGGRGYDGMVE